MVFDWGRTKTQFFFGIANILAVERDIKPQTMTFAKLDKGGTSNIEGAFIQINMVLDP